MEPFELNISPGLARTLSQWVSEYRAASIGGLSDSDIIAALDEKGLSLRSQIADELPNQVVGYYSDARLRRLDSFPHV